MPRKGHSEEKIVYVLRQVEAGKTVSEVCREMGASAQAFYSWKRRYAGLGLNELRELRQLPEENRKLRHGPFPHEQCRASRPELPSSQSLPADSVPARRYGVLEKRFIRSRHRCLQAAALSQLFSTPFPLLRASFDGEFRKLLISLHLS